MNSKCYKCCAVPMCTNTSIKTPQKIFVPVPSHQETRIKWFQLAMKDGPITSANAYFCEDHFDMPNDMKNFMEYHIMGSVSQIRMKNNCLPTKFFCQSDRNHTSIDMGPPKDDKRQRKSLVEKCLIDSDDNERLNVVFQEQNNVGSSGKSVSTNFLNNLEHQNLDEIRFTPDDFNRICRLCTTEKMSDTFYSMFTDIIFADQQLRVMDMLMALTDIQVSEDNMSLPMNICESCLVKLYNAYLFKINCEHINYSLLTIYENYIKEEKSVDAEIKTESPISDATKLDERSEMHKNSKESEILKDSDDNSEDKDYWSCPSDTENQNNRKKRKDYTDTKRQKVCEVCNESVSIYHFARHMRLHTGEKRKKITIKCEICDKVVTRSFYNTHMNSHQGIKPHKCTYCSKGFVQKGALREHIRIHTGEKPFKCNICDQTFRKSSNLLLHKRRHHNNDRLFHCEYCGKSFITSERLDIHKKLHTSDRPFKCNVCLKTFVDRYYLQNHVRIHSDKTFLCNHCGRGFVRNTDLQKHLVIHSKDRLFSCNICEKTFKQAACLYVHQRTHTDTKPFNCKYCMKSFRRTQTLQIHLRTHTGEKPYSCVICNKKFANKGNLTVHQRYHSGETPYSCQICGKRFYDSSTRNKHARKHINIVSTDS